MSYQFYNILHFLGLMTLFIGLTTVLILAWTGQLGNRKARAIGFAFHGIGLFLLILSGFGMAARLQLFANLPGWIYGKIGVWVLMGLAIAVLRRRPQWSIGNLVGILILGFTAVYLCVFKPF